MPCSDGGYDEMLREQAFEKVLESLKVRNDQLIRVICKIDTQFMNDDGYKLFLMTAGEEVRQVIQEHRITDEERWWNMYHPTYPNFTIGEIAKMVRSGILEDV